MPRSAPQHDDVRVRDFLRQFRAHLARERLKVTRQRDRIAAAFVSAGGHVSVDELLLRVREEDPSIGYATVYRTLKLLVDAGLAGERNFGEGFARYEPLDGDHHDHLICQLCGHIVEFHDEWIEKRQEEVARRHGLLPTHHRHELYGVCERCRRERGGQVVEELHSRHLSPELDGASLMSAFGEYLAREGLKVTRQRQVITEAFAACDGHLSVDDLLVRVRAEEPAVGYATVYRTLRLLVDAGLAACRHFGDGFTRFEPRIEGHHDHLIDEVSGRVIEFRDDEIERRQEEIADRHGFRLLRHRLDLFGRPASGPAGHLSKEAGSA